MMAVVQSSYSERMPAAVAGMLANMRNYDIDTRNVEPTSGIPFGRAVTQGVNDKGAKLAGSTLANFVGVSVRDVTLAPVTADSDYLDEYPYRSDMGVMTRGDIWVTTKEAVAAGNTVYFDPTSGLFGDTTASSGVGPIVGARWMTSAASGALAVLRLGIG